MIASISKRFLIIVDESKLVDRLGKFPLPVEVVVFGWQLTKDRIQRHGCPSSLRLVENKPFITDSGNYLLDCYFEQILEPDKLFTQLKLLVGVVEVGLFTHMATQVLVAHSDGRVTVR
jgi:ribose 5-phosphate isomerase A